MHQRQASSYGRKFHYGSKRIPIVHDLTSLGQEPGIGLVPPEFDDIEGGEQETLDDLRDNLTPL